MLNQLEKFAERSKALPQSALKAVIRKVGTAEIDRRKILQGLGGFVLAVQLLPNSASAFEAYPTQGLNMPHGVRNDPHIFVTIADDGQVSIIAHRSEMGTGSRTTLPMIIAEIGRASGRERV